MERILIVEDESIVALSLQHTLGQLGYEVVGVTDTTAEAVGLAAGERPDLVLMDINLGVGGDGIDAAAEIMGRLRTPVVFLTAYSQDATLRRARELAPYGFLLKPFSPRELHATIQMAAERHRADTARAGTEERLRLALDAAEMGIWELDTGLDWTDACGRTERLLDLDAGSRAGQRAPLLDTVAAEDRAAVGAALRAAGADGGPLRVEFRARRADGSRPWLRMQARSHATAGRQPRLIGVVQDITAQRASQSALAQAATVFNSANEAIFIADAQFRLVAVNAAFSTITGHAAAAAVGRSVGPWLLRAGASPSQVDLPAEIGAAGHWQGEVTATRHGGEHFPAWLNLTRIPSDRGAEAQLVGVLSDIGALRRAEAQLLHLAHHDALTGLPNRLLAMDRLDHAIARARRHRWRAALLMVDLDHFKQVNDTHGHAGGDQLLCTVAARLQATLRAEDTVARLGGDEFVVVLEDIDRQTDLAGVARKLLARLAEPLWLNGAEVRIGASLGASVYPSDGDDRDSLMRAADAAMYAAKKGGGHRLVLYSAL